ncbi:biotin-independent malonate decarboxylase subunit gamma [Vibrio sp. CAIM 722]|uniref:Biotin-independent malonate decarboxylase subunit gamma n=1 Tax=Vibrio eleionomae TaxID=2653505 RepID=A0A7X4LPA6_9VIBR|nr:biotin-independent malonate decarboxylase subunit gamma [Vibrio eleionomae]MZI95501.1 biotin-independent malonate decarboxylase subunit gamma [Vibrio eleionomae]
MSNRGLTWLNALTANGTAADGFIPSVKVVDDTIGNQKARFIAVVTDENNAFPRARKGEVGLLEGWNLAKAISEVVSQDKDCDTKTAIIAVIDVPSQAYGRREEAYGIHQALAAAANAYGTARNAGHPVVGLIVGKAMSGGFLAHGYQANRLIALDDEGCMVHAMGKASAARITLRSVAELEKLAATIPPMAYDIQNYSTLGMLWKYTPVTNAEAPAPQDIDVISSILAEALDDIAKDTKRDLSGRLNNGNRSASLEVRQQMAKVW